MPDPRKKGQLVKNQEVKSQEVESQDCVIAGLEVGIVQFHDAKMLTSNGWLRRKTKSPQSALVVLGRHGAPSRVLGLPGKRRKSARNGAKMFEFFSSSPPCQCWWRPISRSFTAEGTAPDSRFLGDGMDVGSISIGILPREPGDELVRVAQRRIGMALESSISSLCFYSILFGYCLLECGGGVSR